MRFLLSLALLLMVQLSAFGQDRTLTQLFEAMSGHTGDPSSFVMTPGERSALMAAFDTDNAGINLVASGIGSEQRLSEVSYLSDEYLVSRIKDSVEEVQKNLGTHVSFIKITEPLIEAMTKDSLKVAAEMAVDGMSQTVTSAIVESGGNLIAHIGNKFIEKALNDYKEKLVGQGYLPITGEEVSENRHVLKNFLNAMDLFTISEFLPEEKRHAVHFQIYKAFLEYSHMRQGMIWSGTGAQHMTPWDASVANWMRKNMNEGSRERFLSFLSDQVKRFGNTGTHTGKTSLMFAKDTKSTLRLLKKNSGTFHGLMASVTTDGNISKAVRWISSKVGPIQLLEKTVINAVCALNAANEHLQNTQDGDYKARLAAAETRDVVLKAQNEIKKTILGEVFGKGVTETGKLSAKVLLGAYRSLILTGGVADHMITVTAAGGKTVFKKATEVTKELNVEMPNPKEVWANVKKGLSSFWDGTASTAKGIAGKVGGAGKKGFEAVGGLFGKKEKGDIEAKPGELKPGEENPPSGTTASDNNSKVNNKVDENKGGGRLRLPWTKRNKKFYAFQDCVHTAAGVPIVR